MNTATATRTREFSTTAQEVLPGDIVVSATLTGRAIRQRVSTVIKLDVVITDPARRTRTVYPTVRLTFGASRGESRDYAPDSTVTVIR
jgi:hypothetical protein